MPDSVTDAQVNLQKMTRREFRTAVQAGQFQAAIIPTGSIEQHLEHLAMEHDIASSTYVATAVAKRLYPRVLVAVPMAIGISEHHMRRAGSLTAKAGSWLGVLFDAVESLVRHGIHHVLILNGHGGNVAPVNGIFQQWRLYFGDTRPEVNLHFVPYWDLIPQSVWEPLLATKRMPGHAQEFETAMALALFPDNVRHDAMRDQQDKEPLQATAAKGHALAEAAIAGVADYVQGMLDGRNRPEVTGWF